MGGRREEAEEEEDEQEGMAEDEEEEAMAHEEEQPPEMADGDADGQVQPVPDVDDPPISIGQEGQDYVRYVLATCMMSYVVVAQGFFAGVEPHAELLRLLEVARGRDEATARDNVARSQAIRRLRKEDPELPM